MIPRKELVLEEVTAQGYKELRRFWGIPTDDQSVPSVMGFARISVPLAYPSREALLETFADDPFATRASFRPDHRWVRVPVHELKTQTGLMHCAHKAQAASVLYIHFKNCGPDGQETNEIGFEEKDGQLMSTRLAVPGYTLGEYTWVSGHANDGHNRYVMIRGIWVPDGAKK